MRRHKPLWVGFFFVWTLTLCAWFAFGPSVWANPPSRETDTPAKVTNKAGKATDKTTPNTGNVGSPPKRPAKAPNIVIVLLDDAGFMDFGVYGSDTKTPTIDALGKRGAIFSRYYTSPLCGPSRAMLMTGQDNHKVGMGTLVETLTKEMKKYPGYSMVWKNGQKTVASRLKKAGYQTFVTGKWGIGRVGKNLPHRFGFERSFVMDSTGASNYSKRYYLPSKAYAKWFEDGKPTTLPKNYYSSRSIVDKMIQYIDESDSKKPFFAFVSMQALHIPVQVPKKWIDRYNGVFDRGWDVMRQERLEKAIKLGLVPKGTKLAPSPPHHRKWDSLSNKDKKYWARMMQVSAGMMEAADFHTGRLLKHLKKRGKLENTIVIVTSDNGAESNLMSHRGGAEGLMIKLWMAYDGWNANLENLGQPGSMATIGPEWASVSSAPFRHYKFNGSEGGLRVPLVIAGPGVERSGLQGGRAHVTDLTPTVLDAAGVTVSPKEFTGRSLLPMLRGQTKQVYGKNDVVGFEVSGTGAIYRGDWKITRVPPPLGDGMWHLYNITKDPGETHDLADKHPVLFQNMLRDYKVYAQRVGVYETPIHGSARKQLGQNQMIHTFQRFWPVSLSLLLLLLLLVGSLIRYALPALRRLVSSHNPAEQ
ncbi:MAG: arylsulfatase [Deltaproteobacteria bacterium]|nr:MAG: arylsulfatase [Deltaproteobacteria bacterium]